MTGETDDNDSEDDVVRASATVVGTSSVSATATVAFSADNIRERLEDDEYALALVLTATRLENIVSRAVRHHYDWNQEKFESEGYDKYSLGALMQECVEYGALSEHTDELNRMRSGKRKIVSLRNNLVHEYGYLDDIEEDEELQDEVEEAIENAIDFIESVKI
jgi:hypothetical protein